MNRCGARPLLALLVLLIALPCAAAPAIFTGPLTGASESPPNASPGTGTATIRYHADTNMMDVWVEFEGLTMPVTMAHIHCCTTGPGVNAAVASPTPSFPFFPSGVSSGTYQNSFDMGDPTSYSTAFLFAHGDSTAAALAALLGAMGNGRAYFNIHTAAFPGGEIRADLYEQPIFANGFQ